MRPMCVVLNIYLQEFSANDNKLLKLLVAIKQNELLALMHVKL